MTRAPSRAASSRVPSLEGASTTPISSQKSSERTQASIRSASLSVMMHADKPLSSATDALTGNGRTGRTIHTRMSTVLFYDPACQQPYDSRTLQAQALGGTEATLVRVADALGAWVMQ